MKAYSRTIALFALILVLFGMTPLSTLAAPVHRSEGTVISGGRLDNPLDDGGIDWETLQIDDGPAEPQSDGTVLTTEEAILSVRQHMVNRDGSFSVTVAMPDTDINDYAYKLIRHGMDHTGMPKEGDSIRSQFRTFSWNSTQTEDELTVNITATYRSGRSQEAAVDQKVAQIISELDLPRENDYETFRAVYDYLTSHVTYDTANSYNYRHTAYGALVHGLAVCQGFASALYRLCMEAGIDCRYCKSSAQSHAWNIIGLGDEYYLVDATWDRVKDEPHFYRYCLNGTEDWMTRHVGSNKVNPSLGDEFISKKDPNGNMDLPLFDPVEQYPLSRVNFEEGRHLLSVEYVYPDGSPAAEPYSGMLWPLDAYSIPVPVIDGYAADREAIAGSMPGHDLTITVEYVPEGHVHEWDAGTVTTAATCTDCGVKTYSCSCGAERTERFAPLNHTYSSGICTVCGLQAVAKGKIKGGNSCWTLESEGKLTVFGLGVMGVFSTADTVSWASHLDEISSVEIREGVTTVCMSAFADCPNLASVSLPDGLISICRYAFKNCPSLMEVELPDSVQILDREAFMNCGLTSLSLGSGVYYFGPDCFAGDEELAEVTYAGTLERWCYADIKYEYGNPGYYASSFTIEGKELTGNTQIPDPVRKARPYTFVNRNLTSVEFPQTLEKIEKGAFLGNNGMTEVVFKGDCPEAGESVISDACFAIYYPCANETWTEESLAQLVSEEHMPDCSVEELCTEHGWDGGIVTEADGQTVLRRTCARCGEVDDVHDYVTTSVTLAVDWEDHLNWYGSRPDDVTVTVIGTVDGAAVYEKEYVVKKTGNWRLRLTGLVKYDGFGRRIVYTVVSEEGAKGYKASYAGVRVCNTLADYPRAEYVLDVSGSISIKLTWYDAATGESGSEGEPLFEVYRRVVYRKNNEEVKRANSEKWELIGVTREDSFVDLRAESGKTYEYGIRTASGRSNVGSVKAGLRPVIDPWPRPPVDWIWPF